MSGGGGGGDTQTIQQADPWAGQQPFLSDLFGSAQDVFRNNPQGYFPGQTYLPFNPIQQAGIDTQLGNVTDLQNIGDASQQGLGNLLGASDISNNPALNPWANALGQNLYGNINTTMGQLGRGFNAQQEDLLYGQQNQIGEASRAFQNQAGLLGLGLGDQIGQQQRAYDVASGRAFDDLSNLRERQGREFDVFRNRVGTGLSEFLPSISAEAVAAGQPGSSRQGVAEGIAIKNAQDRIAELARTQDETFGANVRSSGLGLGDLARSQSEGLGQTARAGALGLGQLGTSQAELLGRGLTGGILGSNQLAREQAGQLGGAATNLTGQANLGLADFFANQYGQGLDATKAGILGAPSVAGLTQAPGQALSQVGQTLQNQAMLPLQEQISRYNFNQQAPWNALNQYASIINGLPGGFGTTSTTATGPEGSQFGSAVGGGLTGLGVAGALGLSNPWTLGLGALGALGGLF